MSHPTWVRGLKYYNALRSLNETESHPTWVRGLKFTLYIGVLAISPSHPTWVRGLKFSYERHTVLIDVAPHVGAWIEITKGYE